MRRPALLASLAVVLLASGCVGLLGGGGDVDPATVDEQVESELAGVETLRMTINQTVDTPNGTHTVRFRVSYERPDRVNYTILDGQLPWTYAVGNASGTWLYNGSADRATFSPSPIATDPRDLFYGIGGIGPNATFEGNETLAGEDAVELSYAVSESEVSLVVAGGDRTSQFGRSASNGTLRTRVWLDTDLWLPRKTRVNLTSLEPNRTLTVRYDDIAVDSEIPDGALSFDPPPDTQIRRGDQSRFRLSRENATFFESRSALVSGTDLPVPEPSVPATYEFQRGAAFDAQHPGVELTYADGSSLIEVAVIQGNDSFVSGSETVRVGGVEGVYAELPRTGILEWNCGGETRVVVAQDDRETLVSVAESVGC